jgi:hypothetical protein
VTQHPPFRSAEESPILWEGEDQFTPLNDRSSDPPLRLPAIDQNKRMVLVRTRACSVSNMLSAPPMQAGLLQERTSLYTRLHSKGPLHLYSAALPDQLR